MIVLDENIPEDQCRLLRSGRIRFRQIGQDVGKQGMKDEQHVLPLLHSLPRPTFFTRDLDFFDPLWRHDGYGLVCLAVSLNEVARFIKRFLRHPLFNTKTKRMGIVARVSSLDIRYWSLDAVDGQQADWIN